MHSRTSSFRVAAKMSVGVKVIPYFRVALRWKREHSMRASFTRLLVCPVLIGRGPLLDTLVQLIEQARGGHGQTALIAGEAGIGKSRVVADALKNSRSP